ncbi:hypothetical protein NHJ6243_006412 [Beauveria neobassiana]
MPDAKASGADTGGGGAARARDHNQGNQGRSYTVEQKAAVLRIRRCNATAFYEILDLESVRATCTESEIKKAYRKQSLLTHPDKNGHEHADEAFKMVSRAFGVLGDKEKRQKYDRFGTDPDSRFASAQAQNPFSGFASRQASGGGRPGGPMGGGGWDEDISPEEMFARFFGGGGGFGGFGGGGGGGVFDTGPQFVFNFGGGPGIRVHQFGGARPRGRPRDTQNQPEEGAQGSGLQNLIGILPILLFFILPLLTSLFGGDGGPATPNMTFDSPSAPYTHMRTTPVHGIKYFVRERDIRQYTKGQLGELDRAAEQGALHQIRSGCEREQATQRRMREDAMGWFYQDEVKMALANALEMPHCKRWTALVEKSKKGK